MSDGRRNGHYRHFDLEEFLPYWLSVLSNTVSQGIARFYQQTHGLSVPEWRVMAVLGRYPGITASEVGERTVMDKVTVSRAVNTLLDKGYLERVTDASDRRKRPLRVSAPRGTAIMEAVIPYALDYQAALLADLTPAELETFQDLSARLLQAAGTLNEHHSPNEPNIPKPRPKKTANG
ncbi:MarR family winged helix-turn-helix transcriptional regulator [Elongatibacter sediminis]|uniref:MarR family winged helix-turn-helix transcriptional regulator n=1 Tax=Elongatibacter sediminis TaxID=3119006 RepID=A0AAW9RLJ4_9GAMM